MRFHGYLAFYESIGNYYEGGSEGSAHSLGILSQDKPTLETWMRLASLVHFTGLHKNILPEIEDMPRYIDELIEDNNKFNTRLGIINAGEDMKEEEIFSDKIAYLKFSEVGEIETEGIRVNRGSKHILRGPIDLNIPPMMHVFIMSRDERSRIGDRADEIFANTRELIRICGAS